MRCAKCGSDNREGRKFCAKCAAPLARVCPQCDAANEPDEAMWQWVASPQKAPDKPAVVEIGFDGGTPVSVNGKKRSAVALLDQLNEIAAGDSVAISVGAEHSFQ